ncbi:thioredoxin domain-containing protein [Humidisolicoccus flavus]|uniref:thioredoxin domain-containing protein n=1 Tax=Humidisolicoccus flavus TaxID=3111414 RepID=UPI0032557301
MREHAAQPVAWFPWGEEAFAEAAARDVPVFVSVGYASCHWCTVMARESFEDEHTAARLNEGFVAIKVDREERPDVNDALMAAAGAFSKHLGWPLSVVLTPEGAPFFAGAYFPKTARSGLPALEQVLEACARGWSENRERVVSTAAQVQSILRTSAEESAADSSDLVGAAFELISALEDRSHGGINGEQKFPHAALIVTLSEHGQAALARRLLRSALPLRAEDGGFFRYATRPDWGTPHYERTVTDNAQLLRAATTLGEEGIARGIVQFLITTLRLPSGVFAAAQDADNLVAGVLTEGAWYRGDRASMEPPAIDPIAVTAHGGLVIDALARFAMRFDQPSVLALAEESAQVYLRRLGTDGAVRVHATLDRSSPREVTEAGHSGAGDAGSNESGTNFPAGIDSEAPVTATDVGLLASGLLSLARATGNHEYALAARSMIELSPEPDGTVATGGQASAALSRPPETDGDFAGGRSALAEARIALYELGSGEEHLQAAEALLEPLVGFTRRAPIGGSVALRCFASLNRGPETRIVTGIPTNEDREAVSTLVLVTPGQCAKWSEHGFGVLFAEKTAPAAYVCESFVCALPRPRAPRKDLYVSSRSYRTADRRWHRTNIDRSSDEASRSH